MVQDKPKRHSTIEDFPQKFSQEGKPLCRICEGEITPPRRTFCSEECVSKYYIVANGSYARDQVFKRDRGVCSSCGLDTEELRSLLYKIKTQKGDQAYLQLLNYYKEQYKFNFALDTHAWEADHIKPVAEGGGSCGLENLQTLCRACHRIKTLKQFRRAKKVKTLKQYQAIQRSKQERAYKEFEQRNSEDEDFYD